MSNREFTATRTMLAKGFATAGAELLDYMGTAAALAAIPNTDPPRYVVAGTLAMIAKVLPSADAPAAATVLTDERIHQLTSEIYFSDYQDNLGGYDIAVARAIEREVLAHAGVTAEPAGRGQTDETDISARLRQRAAGAMANQDDAKLMLTAADECNRFYNGMMNWKANAQAKDRTIIELRETSRGAQVPAAEVRAVEQRLDEMQAIIRAGSKWNGNEQDFADKSESDVAMLDDLLSDAFRKLRSLAHQSTADKASEVRAASPSRRYWAIHEGDLLGVLSVNIGAAYVDPIAAAKRCRVTIYPLPAAPSTADSANTGALGEKGAEA